MARQPTAAPLPGPAQPQAAEPDVHHVAIQQWRRAILGEQRDLLPACPLSSNASIVWHHAARWLSLISPR